MPQAVTAGVVYLMNAGLSMAAAQVVVYGSMAIAAGYTTVKTAEAKARRAENAARRKAANRAQEIQNMQFGTVAARRFIYGQTITNGHLVFQETAGTDNKDLYRVLYLGEGPIQSADQLFFNEEEITALSGTLDSTAGASVNSGTYNGYLDVQVGKNGGAGANVPTSLTSKLASNTSWTSNHKMTGNSWLAYKVVHNNEVWTSGVPNVRVRVNGRRVYDPRLDSTNGGSGSHRYNDETTWAYSNNSALCVLDFLINGMKVDIDDLDIASFQAAASTCDDNITIINSSGTSTTEKRYTTNGVAFLDEEVISTLEELLIPCHGSLIEEGGTIRLLVPGASTTVTANLTEDDLISELSIKVNAQISSRMNKVGGSFTSAQENYQEVDFSPISSSSLIADDGREHIHELSLAMVTSESHAQRMASIVLKENALTNSINATLKPEFAYLRVGDIVTMTFQPEVIGGSGTDSILTNATKFQVVSYSLQPTGEISVELQEYNDSSYVWNTADHDYVTRTALADSFIETIDKPTFGTPVASNYLDEAGNQVLAFNVPLTPASHPNFAFTSVGLSRIGVASNGVETGIDLVEGKRAGPEDDNLKFSNLSTQIEPGHVNTYVSYKFKLFGRTYIENGKRSAARELDVTSYIAVDTTAPARPTSFTATGGLNQITLNWVNPTDIDFDKVKVFRHTSNSSGASTEIGETRGTSFVDAGLSNSTQRYYWIKSVDKVGNLSAFRGQVNATTDAEPPAGLNSATVVLFRKNSNDSSAPSSFSGTFNYNFNTGALSGGTLNSWTQSAPSLGVGEYLWQRTASVSSTSTTTTLATTAFSTASIVGRAGPTGDTGSSVLSIYQQSLSQPTTPSNNANVPSGWSTTTPNRLENVWLSIGAKAAGGTTYVWSDASLITLMEPNRFLAIEALPWTTGSGNNNVNGNVWSDYQESSENTRILATDPHGGTSVVWEGKNTDTTTGADGGFTSPQVPIDRTKDYRFSVWIKQTSNNGRPLFGLISEISNGTNQSVTSMTSGSTTTTPYFKANDLDMPSLNEWYLVVGYVFKNGTAVSGSPDPRSGIYRGTTGRQYSNSSFQDWKWGSTETHALLRAFHNNNTSSSQDKMYFWEPRVDLLDGRAPSIEDLLKRSSPGPTTVTISLFNKNSSPSSAPSTFTGTLTYSLDTGVLTLPGTMNGWSETAPSLSQGEYLWGRFYTFTTSAPTETMTNSDFSSGSVVGLAGPTGPTGDDGEPAIAETLKYYDLQTSGTVTTSGKWKISNSLSATPTTSGVATWSTSIQSLFLHGSDSNGDSRNRFIESLLPGDFCTFTSTQSGKTGRALFRIISISESSNIYTFRVETTVVTGTLSSLTTSSGTIVNFGFSRSDTAGLTVQNGLLIEIDQNPVDKNDATFRQAAPAGSNGGNNSNLSRAFLNVNTNISEMSQIPDRSRVWAKFVMSGFPNNISYRLWDVISQTWSNHALQVGNADDPQPIFAETLISKEAILQHVDAIELDVGKININENINLGDGAAWSTGDKLTPADNTKNGLYFGNPSSASENYAFATTGGVTLDSNNNPVLTNAHGVLFDKNITEIRNPTILKGTTTVAGVQTLNGPAPTSLSSSDWNSTSAIKNTDSITIPANCSVLYIEGVAGGGGGDGAQNNATNTTAHRTGKNSLFRLKNGSTILVQETATGGTPGEGVPSAKTDGTPGQASTFASGGGGGGGNGDGGNGTLGSGGGGGGGRDASAWTTSRKGGIGGNAGGSISRTLNITDIKAQNNISASATLTLELEAGTGGRYSGEVNYGEGGYGGAGFMSYNIETTGLENVVLLTEGEYNKGVIGEGQLYSSFTMGQNTVYTNNGPKPVYISVVEGTAGGGTGFLYARGSSSDSYEIVGRRRDNDQTEILGCAVIPVGGSFYKSNHASGTNCALLGSLS